MNFNFELFLVLACLFTGLIYLLDWLFWEKKRKSELRPMSKIVEYSRSFFPVLVLVLILRSFLVEPYRIPTGSLEPSLIPGDFIAANKFAYGIHLPLSNTRIVPLGEPKLADIVVFRWPVNTSIDFIKRVVGVPGDTIAYKNKVLYLNGVEQKQTYVGEGKDSDSMGNLFPVKIYREDLNGVSHLIQINPEAPDNDFTVTVPRGSYFMMGDNRDNSEDSRYWGFVPEKDLLGKAFLIWMSWNSKDHSVRWHRLGTLIHSAKN